MMASLAQTYARMGRRKDSWTLYMELQCRARREFVAPLSWLWPAYATGERMKRCNLRKSRARLAIQRALESPTVTLTMLLWDPSNLCYFEESQSSQTQTAIIKIYDATWTLTAMFLPPSSRYVTSALALTFSLPSMAVFLSMKNVIVLGSACCCVSC
jgi:hypothetical protein